MNDWPTRILAAETTLRERRQQLSQAKRNRATIIRTVVGEGVSPADIAPLIGVTRTRVYQILDELKELESR